MQRREVASRIYSASARGTTAVGKTEYFQHPNDSAYAGHTQTTINDAAGNRKIWYFTQGDALGWKNGLQWKQEVYQGAGITLLRTFQTDWTQDQPAVAELRNPRPSAQRTIVNDVTPNLESRREQDADSNGNVTQVREYGYGDSSPYRTLTVTYLTGSDYNSRNILDRVTATTLYAGAAGGTILRQTGMGYDVPGSYSNITPAPNMHDSAYGVSMRFRGNPTVTWEANRSKTTYYDILGNARVVVDSLGSQQTASYSAASGYTVPSSTNSSTPLGASMVWNGDLTLSSASAASGESVSYSWDSAKRPSSQTSPSGSQTTYSYNDLGTPPTVVQTTQVHTGGGPPNYTLTTGTYTITRTLDGLGRVVLVQDSRTNAYVKYEYDACSCSPTGRQTKVSNPYLSSETPLWTISEYDALGRVTRVTAPDGSATTTSYSGNTTTVTDPAGKRKKFTYDAFGNLTQVAEPDAQGNLNVFTNYTYDTLGRLTDVSMNGGAQTRHFVYNQYGQVTSATNPENGTVSYSYNNDGTLASKTDAKNQTTLFQYDTYKRLTRIYPGGSYGYEKRFYYDSYEADPGDNRYGRLAAIEWEMPGPPPYTWQTHYWRHVFSYSTYGAVTHSKLVDRYDPVGWGEYVEETLAADFSWTMQGEMWWVGYPSQRQVYYNFDSAGRPNGAYTGISWYGMYPLVSGASYTKAGQLATLDTPSDGYTLRETRSYNDLQQLTGIQAAWTAAPYAVRFDLSYAYPGAGSNNGRISAEINNLTNTQVSYAYDQVNRLATAVSATGGNTNWGLSFSYDVYGNRTAQTVTAGSAPAFSASFGSNNRMVGYSYDNNGNQLTTPDGATLEYDADNRLTKWTKQGQTDQYQYHPSGWRLSKSSEKYLYGPGGQLLESYRAWNDITDYVYFGGRLLYTLSAGPAVTRIYSDRLGSTRVTETIQPYGGGWTTRNYYPFGEEITSTSHDQYKFASTYRDSATGLDYAVNRYYASGAARFLTPDPLGHGAAKLTSSISWNLYVYSRNDPVNGTDPSGLDPVDVAGLYVAASGTRLCSDHPDTASPITVTASLTSSGGRGPRSVAGSLTVRIDDESGAWSESVYQVGAIITAVAELGPEGTQTYSSSWSNLETDRPAARSVSRIRDPRATPGQPFSAVNGDSTFVSAGKWYFTNTVGQSTSGTFHLAVGVSTVGGVTTISQDYSQTSVNGTTSLQLTQVFSGGTLQSYTRVVDGESVVYRPDLCPEAP